MRNISMFIFNFNYIKDLARVIMDEKCNGVYCEAETDRYQIAKNSYRLLMPNDVFNSKTYIIFTFIISIMIFIYYYSMLDLSNYEGTRKQRILYVLIHASLLIILFGMIIYRYIPYDEAGYLNYFKDFGKGSSQSDGFGSVVALLMYLFIPAFIVILKRDDIYELWGGNDIVKRFKGLNIFIALCCIIASITLMFNLMNIVMSFRTNTTPILKTKCLGWSLQQSFKGHVSYKIDDNNKATFIEDKTIQPATNQIKTIEAEYDIINKELTKITNKDATPPTKSLLEGCGANISSALDVLIAFEELTNVVINGLSTEENKHTTYVIQLKNIINNNYKILDGTKNDKYELDTSEFALIFDKKVSIPNYYDENAHSVNSNDRNEDYVYTADISYDNANVFYEKYWDMKDDGDEGDFLWKYDYFVPTYLFGGQRPNLFKILYYVAIFTVSIFFLSFGLFAFISWDDFSLSKLLKMLMPLIALVVFLTFIIVFIRFNTNFNKNVVYKCLDCSYKRALNKLNTVVSPYIRMYDTKITTGNKNYLHHYIITNVFYSILSGNINLNDNLDRTINIDYDDKYYYGIEGIKSNRLKFTGMNNSMLSNDSQFREYYKSRYSDLYKGKNNKEITDIEIKKIYGVFSNIFATYSNVPTTEALIDTYFQSTVLKKEIILKIYSIIKKCFELFNEETFNNNLVYYNNRDPKRNSATQITIDNYKHFAFYKNGDKLIPHQFILKLTKSKYEAFVGEVVVKVEAIAATGTTPLIPAIPAVAITPYHTQTITDFETTLGTLRITITDMTPILDDISDEDSINQTPEVQNKNVIKIIAKYLLILGHINYNGIEYNKEIVSDSKTQAIVDANKKQIYEQRTYKLYQLISNVSYNDTFEIDDTFVKISDIATGGTTGTITAAYKKYKRLTYMYNYLETKYVSLSSNNNKNYLLNIIQSINNTLNNDGKIITPITGNKESKYLFAKRIEEMRTPAEYEVEDAILEKAIRISTTSFESTYYMNMLILICFIIGTIKSV